MRRSYPILLIVALIAGAARGQVQNPSPMVETTRAHTRVQPEEVRLQTIDAGLPVSLFIAEGVSPGELDLLIHFMGAEYVPAQAVRTSRSHDVLAVVNLGSGSGVFERPFREDGTFARLLEAIATGVAGVVARPARFRRIDLSAFSAGYGAVRAILSEDADRIDGILLLDALHTGYVPDRKVLAEGGRLDTTLLAPFVRFAKRAVAGETSFVLTHSEIFPGTFASTTETADYLVRELSLERAAVLKWGPVGMQQLSEVHAGGLVMLGFAGNTAPDHVDHLHGMGAFLALLNRP